MNETPTTAVAVKEKLPIESAEPFYAFGSIVHFEQAQRMANALCSSSIVPDTYKGTGHIGDCLIALEISNRIGANVLAVMQNLYIVHGKPAWSSQFLISCVNASRRFSPLRYKMTGVKGQDDWGCIAWATDKGGEVLESPEVTVGMAKAEGWFQKNGSKWKTMPELMLRYRAATFFTRLYAPEITMGIVTREEVDDFIDVPAVVTTVPKPDFSGMTPAKPVEVLPVRVARAKNPKPHDTTKSPAAPAPAPASEPEAVSQAAPASDPPEPPTPPTEPPPANASTDLRELRLILGELEITEAKVLSFCEKNNILSDLGDAATTLEQLPAVKIESLLKNLKLKNQPLIEKIRSI